MKTAKQVFPELNIYTDKTVVLANRFTGEQVTVTGEEASVYDLIVGAEMFGQWDIVRKGLAWFRQKNAEAYMVLLD